MGYDKIIFLDFDGVLNLIPQGHDRFGGIFHPHLVDNLAHIISETNANIVISSSWRSDGIGDMREMWETRGYPGIIVDVTPIGRFMYSDELITGHKRGYDIKYWLGLNKVNNYVIIDDDIDMLEEQMKNFVKTSDNDDHEDCVDIGYGLTKKCAEQAIKILNNEV